mmetsp:Transcript_18270/g.24086  ORF Transcript_18270/g.24086 Transcript_18270/m.24086 type:complete len:101 (+) Transcript_18270:625-927(+)
MKSKSSAKEFSLCKMFSSANAKCSKSQSSTLLNSWKCTQTRQKIQEPLSPAKQRTLEISWLALVDVFRQSINNNYQEFEMAYCHIFTSKKMLMKTKFTHM